MRSASVIVETRCATTIFVTCGSSRHSAWRSRASVVRSSAENESSNTRIFGWCTIARAIARTLTLTAGDVRAALGDARVEPVGHLLDEVTSLRDVERVPELLVGRLLASVAQVRRDGSGEEERTLRYEADAVPQRLDVGLAHIRAADVHGSARDVEEPRDERDERRLAGTGGSDDRHRLSGLGREADAAQHRGVGTGVGELHIVERDGSGNRELGDGRSRGGPAWTPSRAPRRCARRRPRRAGSSSP